MFCHGRNGLWQNESDDVSAGIAENYIIRITEIERSKDIVPKLIVGRQVKEPAISNGGKKRRTATIFQGQIRWQEFRSGESSSRGIAPGGRKSKKRYKITQPLKAPPLKTIRVI